MSSYMNNEFALERISKQINSRNKRVVALYGLSEENAPQYLNDIKELNQEVIKTAAWTSPAPATKEELAEDIKATLLINTTKDNLQFVKKKNFFSNTFKKIHANRIRRKINEFEPYKQENSRTKTLLWPIINTISSLGLALGVPLLSVILFRQEAIIYGSENAAGQTVGALGVSFYVGMITLAVLLIVLGAFASLLGLIITLFQNRKEYNWMNVNENLQKIINRYFVLDDGGQTYKKLSWFKRLSYKTKFVISNDYTFFYTNVDPNVDDYSKILESIKILNSLNNNVIFCLINVKYIDDIRIFKNIFPSGKTKILRMDSYKNGSNIRIMTNYIMNQIKLITGLEPQALIRKHPHFVNALYKFIDKSTNNEQFISALLMLKKIVGKTSSTTTLDDTIEKYFVDIFCLCMFNGLDSKGYQNLFRDISIYGDISDETKENETFIMLKIYEIFNRNLILYKQNSIFFKLKEFMIGVTTLKSLERQIKVNSEKDDNQIDLEKEKEYLVQSLKNRGYEEIENNLPNFNMKFRSNFDTNIYVKFADEDLSSSQGLVYIESNLMRAKEEQVEGLVLDLYGNKLFYELIDTHYELISIL